jgi:preprotein translocase subunit SecB
VPHCGQRGASGAPHWPQNRIPGGFSNWHCPHVIIAYIRECIADITVTSAARGIQPLATSPPRLATPA